MLQKTSAYAPDITKENGKILLAYTLRKQAQWSVVLRKDSTARQMINQALISYWQIILEEPFRTLIILGAIYSLSLFPRKLYLITESFALRFIGSIQRIRLSFNPSLGTRFKSFHL